MFELYTQQGPVEAVGEPTAVTVGVFDGVHLGHRALLRQLAADGNGMAPLAVTLTSHPSFVLGRRSEEHWLDEEDEHRQLLFEAGCAALPFTREVASLSACAMAKAMVRQLGMRHLLLGYDGRFGSRANDDFASLPGLAAREGFSVSDSEPFLMEGRPVSSSRIREALQRGDVEAAAGLLGRRYSLGGKVAHGRGVGRTLGFPTANVDLAGTRKTLPADGVYAVRLDGMAAMANLGSAPTFGVDGRQFEVHLLDFGGDIYGEHVEVEFCRFIRPTRQFASADELKEQLQLDAELARQCADTCGNRISMK